MVELQGEEGASALTFPKIRPSIACNADGVRGGCGGYDEAM
jgi:hypothetical protein